MRDFQFTNANYSMKVAQKTAKPVKASFDGQAVALTEDFALKYALDARARFARSANISRRNGSGILRGFVAGGDAADGNRHAAPRTVVALFDTSLSMQWEKLERSFHALESLLRSLKPADRFNLLVYNEKVAPFQPAPVEATPDAIEKALAFLRAQQLRGGTNVQAALDAGLAQAFSNDPYLVVLGDLGATRGILQERKARRMVRGEVENRSRRRNARARMFSRSATTRILPLARCLRAITECSNAVRSTEPIDFKLNAFLIEDRAAAGGPPATWKSLPRRTSISFIH